MNVSFAKSNQGGVDFIISTTDELQESLNFLSEDFPIALITQNFCHATSDYIPFHWHDEFQIIWVHQGQLEYTVSGKQVLLGSDELLFVNKYQLHSSKTVSQDARTICINFSAEIFHPQAFQNCILPLVQDAAFSHAVLPLQFYQIGPLKKFLEWNNTPMEYFSVINFLSQAVEIMLNGFVEKNQEGNHEEVELLHRALELIHRDYVKPLTVKQISDYTLVNKNRLTMLFQKYTNTSPIKYLNDYRLYNAKNMILQSDKPISEICADVGFNQLSHFIKSFRETYGLPPLKYRNKYRAAARYE